MLNRLEKLPFYISIVSAIVVLIACIIVGAQLYIMAAWVSLTIALFYIIGEFTRFFFATKVFPPEEAAEEDSEFLEIDAEIEELEEDVGEEAEETAEGDNEADTEYENEPVEDAFLD